MTFETAKFSQHRDTHLSKGFLMRGATFPVQEYTLGFALGMIRESVPGLEVAASTKTPSMELLSTPSS